MPIDRYNKPYFASICAGVAIQIFQPVTAKPDLITAQPIANSATLSNLSQPSQLAQQAAKLAPPVAPSALPPASPSARDLFARYKDRLVQVRILRNSANEQSSLGSGFVVRDDGAGGAWLLTNYHVVSSLAINPEKFRLELRQTSERTVRAKLMAIDVIHDLAVLRTEPESPVLPWPAFSLREPALAQGERVFSLGNPLELGFLISEGIYNGPVESRIYEQMLFSGALNSGMSGGPAIDESGRVVGVNVATHRHAMLISFLVPIRYARELLERAWKAAPRNEWRTEIARQLLVHQDFVAGKFLTSEKAKPSAATSGPTSLATPAATPTAAVTAAPPPPSAASQPSPLTVPSANAGFASQTLSGRLVPTLDGSLTKCWAGGRDGERLRYQQDTLNCSLHSELFVRNNLYAGSLSISHTLLRNDKLATPQFLALFNQSTFLNSLYGRGNAEMTPAECRDDYVKTSAHVYRVSICLTGFRKFDGVYNYTVSANQVDDASERLSSVLSMKGVSFENGQRLSGMFLERLR